MSRRAASRPRTTDLAPGVDELSLIVRALADIREALRSSDAQRSTARSDRHFRGPLPEKTQPQVWLDYDFCPCSPMRDTVKKGL